MKKRIVSSIALLGILFFASCESTETTEAPAAQTDNQEIASDLNIDIAVDDIVNVADDQFLSQQSPTSKSAIPFQSILPICAKVSSILVDGVWKRTIDFGTEGCALPNGNMVKGKIFISFANNFSSIEQKITYRLEGFYHNGRKIEGTETIVRVLKSSNYLADIHPVVTATLNMTITTADGKVQTRKGTRVREMVEGNTTPGVWQDNVFLVWGYTTTTLDNGDVFTNKVSENPLRFASACKKPFPVKGTINHTKANAQGVVRYEAKMDFGTGDCDNLATITIAGITVQIELKN